MGIHHFAAFVLDWAFLSWPTSEDRYLNYNFVGSCLAESLVRRVVVVGGC
jgi:hypothetical protein